MVFGNDGMLYVTSGDGTSDSDANLTGQDMSSLLGKVLRIDVDHPNSRRASGREPDVNSGEPGGVSPELFRSEG